MKNTLLVVIVALSFQMCNSRKTVKQNTAFNVQIDSVMSNYQNLLDVNSIDINIKEVSNKKNGEKIAHVLIFNSKEVSEAAIPDVSLNMAKDIYSCLLNKNAIDYIDIDFIYEEEYFCNPHRSIKNRFSNKKLEESLTMK